MNPNAQKETRIRLFSFSTPAMRAFHMSWLAFFVCFFAWFAVAPLMPVIKAEFGLTPGQIANINIAAVGITILVRLIIGPLCDKYGPRRTYTALLALGAVPVLGIAFAQSYESFLVFRLLIGAIGGTGNLTKVGPGKLVMEDISNPNTFSGSLTVAQGEVQARQNKARNDLIIAAGATFSQNQGLGLNQDSDETTTGDGTLNLGTRSFSGSGASQFNTVGFPTGGTILPGNSVDFNIRFTPTSFSVVASMSLSATR